MKLSYQSHIDILRALAVLLVIFNHLEIQFFSGGYIGVDIFFVISGYLITKNIIKEKQATGFFSFKDFYTRRIIRLAPSFFTMILISSLFFLAIMTSEEILNYLKTVIASLTLTSNIYYTSLLNNYFSISAKSTPLLHIWSLSLEEQFYLFWPIFFIAIYRSSTHLKVISIFILTTISLIVSYKLTQDMPIAAYYLLPSRIFEFGIGALLCFLPPSKINKIQSLSYCSIILVGLFIASHLINENTAFPSYTALIPCLLTAVFIYIGQSFSNKYSKPIEYIGKISYPMYLWHWPIIVYLSLLSINITPHIQTMIILITIALSILTYEYIEKLMKKYVSNTTTSIKTFFVFPLIVTILILIIIYQELDKFKNNSPNTKISNSIKCIDQSKHPSEDCHFGNSTQKKISIFLVGDSHANAQSGFIDHLAKKEHLSGYEMTFSSTAFLPHIDRSIYDHQLKKVQLVESFKKNNEDILVMLQKMKPKIVVMGGFFPHNWERSIYSTITTPNLTSKEAFLLGLSNAIIEIQKIGAKPVIINDNPILVDININCNLRKSTNLCYFPKEKYLTDFQEWKTILTLLKKKHPELTIIDFNDIICDNTKCYSSLNNIPLYRDRQHMTYSGSQEIAKEYLKIYKNPFSNTYTE